MKRILNKIKEIADYKRANKIEPLIVLNMELLLSLDIELEEYKKAINTLIREGKITFGITLNDFYYKLN